MCPRCYFGLALVARAGNAGGLSFCVRMKSALIFDIKGTLSMLPRALHIPFSLLQGIQSMWLYRFFSLVSYNFPFLPVIAFHLLVFCIVFFLCSLSVPLGKGFSLCPSGLMAAAMLFFIHFVKTAL